jgi:hypothetical protein
LKTPLVAPIPSSTQYNQAINYELQAVSSKLPKSPKTEMAFATAQTVPTKMKAVIDIHSWFLRIGVSRPTADAAISAAFKVWTVMGPIYHNSMVTLKELAMAFETDPTAFPEAHALEELFAHPAIQTVLTTNIEADDYDEPTPEDLAWDQAWERVENGEDDE